MSSMCASLLLCCVYVVRVRAQLWAYMVCVCECVYVVRVRAQLWAYMVCVCECVHVCTYQYCCRWLLKMWFVANCFVPAELQCFTLLSSSRWCCYYNYEYSPQHNLISVKGHSPQHNLIAKCQGSQPITTKHRCQSYGFWVCYLSILASFTLISKSQIVKNFDWRVVSMSLLIVATWPGMLHLESEG